jgi:hypothetical protein
MMKKITLLQQENERLRIDLAAKDRQLARRDVDSIGQT